MTKKSKEFKALSVDPPPRVEAKRIDAFLALAVAARVGLGTLKGWLRSVPD